MALRDLHVFRMALLFFLVPVIVFDDDSRSCGFAFALLLRMLVVDLVVVGEGLFREREARRELPDVSVDRCLAFWLRPLLIGRPGLAGARVVSGALFETLSVARVACGEGRHVAFGGVAARFLVVGFVVLRWGLGGLLAFRIGC